MRVLRQFGNDRQDSPHDKGASGFYFRLQVHSGWSQVVLSGSKFIQGGANQVVLKANYNKCVSGSGQA